MKFHTIYSTAMITVYFLFPVVHHGKLFLLMNCPFSSDYFLRLEFSIMQKPHRSCLEPAAKCTLSPI